MSTIIALLVLFIACWVVFWLCDNIAAPAPFGIILKVIVAIFAIVKALALVGISF